MRCHKSHLLLLLVWLMLAAAVPATAAPEAAIPGVQAHEEELEEALEEAAASELRGLLRELLESTRERRLVEPLLKARRDAELLAELLARRKLQAVRQESHIASIRKSVAELRHDLALREADARVADERLEAMAREAVTLEQDRHRLQKQLEAARAEIARLKKGPAPQGAGEATVEASVPTDEDASETGSSTAAARVRVHYNATDEGAARAFAKRLEQHGFEVAELRSLDLPIARGTVRFFHESDTWPARTLQVLLSDWAAGRDLRSAAHPGDFSRFRPLPERGHLEVWLPTPSA